ncbi:VacJ family lipoprotein [Sulfitobacter sp. D35]|uniref:MlaA family lipoprotein n=1 Tax=Sulfitobacter sp. D35 TaxID=3083252 RepID=UPI00296ED88F|nr:VacJ family lipoprotein [Sulfitobacter sp. D35]MDW4500165.1 VacJ family lipoprotein [Sulfitobacter sp. D35]
MSLTLRPASAFARPALLVSVLLLGACAGGEQVSRNADGIYDPYEARNRRVHEFNKSFDRNFFRPVANGYAAVLPLGVRNSVNNFSDNLQTPGVAVNSLLQGNFADASIATFRFAFNSTIGFGGIFDGASEFNIPKPDTDFGETLAVWGVPEGAYIEVPFIGPSTVRDSAGRVIDFFTNTNPATAGLDFPQRGYPIATQALAGVNNRAKFGDTIDSVLYESADSYAQTRLIYLQSSRFGIGTGLANAADPYTDPYANPYADPYADAAAGQVAAAPGAETAAPAAAQAPAQGTALPAPYEDPYDLLQ